MYVKTYFLSQLRKMLILLISSYCKMCTLPTLRSHVFVCCEQYKHRNHIVGNGHILQWELMSKINILRIETKNVFIHTRSSAPNMFAKFGWKTGTFGNKKVAKVIAKLKSDRL